MSILAYVQYGLGKAFSPIRGHDSKAITKTPAFKDIPQPNMTLEAPECGPSGSKLLDHHTCLAKDGKGDFPELRWSAPGLGDVKEYVLICEDLDLPIPGLVMHHGIFYGIPPSTTSATNADVQHNGKDAKDYVTTAGWKYIPNMMGSPYLGPAPPLGHGSHRYVFYIVALKEPLDPEQPEKLNRQTLAEAMTGKVIGWGQWIGTWERPWPR
uniref:Phosphatidylethanolamine-binding protein-like protein n=1 Tax=Paecilomyces fulvus TaxID=89137 RepID=A0A172WCV2_9EURO|nr:phosphatidylethanolamine-binding protein-like protein [Paecilomyces fulvus]